MTAYSKHIQLPATGSVDTPDTGRSTIYYGSTTSIPEDLLLKSDAGIVDIPNINRGRMLPSAHMYIFDDLVGTVSTTTYQCLVRFSSAGGLTKGTSTGDHMGTYIVTGLGSTTTIRAMYTDSDANLVANGVLETVLYFYPDQTYSNAKFGRTAISLGPSTAEIAFQITEGVVHGRCKVVGDIEYLTSDFPIPLGEWLRFTILANSDRTVITFKITDSSHTVVYEESITPVLLTTTPGYCGIVVWSSVINSTQHFAIDSIGFGHKIGYYNMFGRMP